MLTLEDVFKNSDLGVRTIKEVVIESKNPPCDFSRFDTLTNYIATSFVQADDLEDFVSNLDYAIDQLQRAKRNTQEG